MSRRRKRRNRNRIDFTSRLALRADGAMLLSTKDLGDRDLSGCQIESYVILQGDRAAFARKCLSDWEAHAAGVLWSAFPARGAARVSPRTAEVRGGPGLLT